MKIIKKLLKRNVKTDVQEERMTILEKAVESGVVQEIVKPKPKPPIATKTMLVSLMDLADKKQYNMCLPNFNSRYELDKQTGTFTLFTKLPNLTPGKVYTVLVLSTNDPTPGWAGGLISLGYYRYLWDFKEALCICANPPIFEGWGSNFRQEMLLPMRETI